MKNILKNSITLILCFILAFTTLSQSIFAETSSYLNSIDTNGSVAQLSTNKYNDALFGGKWERKYEIEVKNTKTQEVISTIIPAVNGGTINRNIIANSLPKEYKLVKFNVYVNKNYTSTTKSTPGFSTCYFESPFDVACLTVSVVEFAQHPSFWTGFGVVLDGLAVVLPGVPAVGGITLKAIESSPKLFNACKYGIKAYDELAPLIKGKLFNGLKMNAHHIMPQKFASLFGVKAEKMWSIALDTGTHSAISARIASMFPKAASNYKDKQVVKNGIKYVYQQMYEETEDYLYKFMADFIEEIDNFAPVP